MMNPDPDSLLTRARGAEELTRAGYPTSKASLATLACRGGGPLYRLYSRTALYRWGDLLAWAKARCTLPHKNTSEADVILESERPHRTV